MQSKKIAAPQVKHEEKKPEGTTQLTLHKHPFPVMSLCYASVRYEDGWVSTPHHFALDEQIAAMSCLFILVQLGN